MPRYIKADALMENAYVLEYKDEWNMTKYGEFVEVADIESAPTADVVEVVRCKECKHRDAETGFCEGRGFPMQLVPDDGFCDKGERSEDVEETN